jgi:hypothetical protein
MTMLSATENDLARLELAAAADAHEQRVFLVRELAGQQHGARTHHVQRGAGVTSAFRVDG